MSEQEQLEVKFKKVKNSEYENVLEAWAATQPLPEETKLLGKGEVFPKKLHPNSLLYMKLEDTKHKRWAVLFASHIKMEGSADIVYPLNLIGFKSQELMDVAISLLEAQALGEWKQGWWMEREGTV